MTIDKTLNENNINLKHQQEGNQKVKCPQCQPPHNSRDNPLSVTITNDRVQVLYIHHIKNQPTYNLNHLKLQKAHLILFMST